MRTALVIAIAVFGLASPTLADDAADIRAAETAWNAAIWTKDMVAIDRLMDKNFQLTGGAAACRYFSTPLTFPQVRAAV